MSEAHNETYSLRFASTSPTDPFENQLLSYRSVPHSEQREEENLKKVPRICRVKAMDCAATFIAMHQRTFIYPRWCLTNSTSPEWVDFGFDILDIDVKATCGSRSTTSKCRRFICLQRSVCLSRIYYFPRLTRFSIGWLTNRGSYGVANLPALRTGGASRCFKGHFGSSCKDKD